MWYCFGRGGGGDGDLSVTLAATQLGGFVAPTDTHASAFLCECKAHAMVTKTKAEKLPRLGPMATWAQAKTDVSENILTRPSNRNYLADRIYAHEAGGGVRMVEDGASVGAAPHNVLCHASTYGTPKLPIW